MMITRIKLPSRNAEEFMDSGVSRRIIIIENDDERVQGKSDVEYLKLLSFKYTDKYNDILPYHYAITQEPNIYSVRSDFTKINVPGFESYKNDIVIYTEFKHNNASEAQKDALIKVCTLLIEKYSISYNDIALSPYDSIDRSSKSLYEKDIAHKVSLRLESKDPINITMNSFLNSDENESIRFIKLQNALSPKDISDMTGIPEHIVVEQNQHILNPKDTLSVATFATRSLGSFAAGSLVMLAGTQKGFASSDAKSKSNAASSKATFFSKIDNFINFSSINTKSSPPSKEPDILGISSRRRETNFSDSIRPYSESVIYSPELPGYKNAYLEFLNLNTGDVKVVGFMISPNGVSFSMSNTNQVNKTMAGWYLMRTGKNLQNISINGYMLDTASCQERHDFIEEFYKKYVEDKKNANNEYVNEWSTNLIIEGRKYIGIINGMTIQKSSMQQFLYQYNINFLSIDDVLMHRSPQAMSGKLNPAAPNSSKKMDSAGSIMISGDAVSGLLGIV